MNEYDFQIIVSIPLLADIQTAYCQHRNIIFFGYMLT